MSWDDDKPKEIFIHGAGGHWDNESQFEFSVTACHRDIWEPDTRDHYIEKSAYDQVCAERDHLKNLVLKFYDFPSTDEADEELRKRIYGDFTPKPNTQPPQS